MQIDNHASLLADADSTRQRNGRAIGSTEYADDPPLNEYREASRHLLTAMNRCMDWLRSPANSHVAWWQVQFALGTIHCEGKTMTQAALDCGVKRATISKGATELCRICGIDPSFYMKREDAQQSYRNMRRQQLFIESND